MKRIAAILVGLECAIVASADSLPRGVAPEFQKFYQDATTFTCISNPTISIPFAQVNDDYCDCPDGSDEPGTAACAHLSRLSPQTSVDRESTTENISAALPGFWCENKRHLPGFVPFSNVNDGICDYDLCCDGSEEWQGVGGVKCPNKCVEIGNEWRKLDQARTKALEKAQAKRRELLSEASKMRLELEDKVKALTAEVGSSELKVKAMEEELVQIEKSEAGKILKAGKAGGKLGNLVTLAKRRTEELRSALLEQMTQNAVRRERLENLEAIMATFKEEYNPNFNDEGVKRAVRAWEDYVASKPADPPSVINPSDLSIISQLDKDNGLVWDEFEQGDEEEVSETDVCKCDHLRSSSPTRADWQAVYSFENYLPPTLRTWASEKLRDLRAMLVQNGILADTGSSGGSPSESKAVKQARERLEGKKRELETQRQDLQNTQEDLGKDFGPDDIFRALKGKCVETDSGEYTYELCFLEKTMQKPKKGGGHTNMGTFTRIEKVVVDEELPADGKGLGSGERYAMKHENGQHCWNGPHRSTTVVLACSENNEIWKIVEEEKCVYRMEVGTPAVCEVQARESEGQIARDEL